MTQPPGFINNDFPDHVCLLNKSLYGLKQASHLWNIEMNQCLLSIGFQANPASPCIYIRSEPDSSFSIIFLWVDDVLIGAKTTLMLGIKDAINSCFKITDMGPVKYFIGHQIEQNPINKQLFIHQSNLTTCIIAQTHLIHAISTPTPMDPYIILTSLDCPQTDAAKLDMSTVPYRSIIGSLLYLSLCTRPDICSAVNLLSRYVSNPGRNHWNAVKHLIRYLIGTQHYGLTISGTAGQIYGYADANWGGNIDTRRSTTGFIFFLGSTPISWCSKTQKTVALSSCEAEYMALAAAVSEALWLLSILHGFGINQKSMIIYEDNQGCIELSKTTKHHGRSKHIDMRYHFIREQIYNNIIKVIYCQSKEMIADLFTKPAITSIFKLLSPFIITSKDNWIKGCNGNDQMVVTAGNGITD